LYREVHSVGSEHLMARSLATVTAGFIIMALPAVAGGMPLAGLYELIVFAAICAALFFQVYLGRAEYIYQLIGDELVVRRQIQSRVKVCARVMVREIAALMPYKETTFASRRKVPTKNLCGRLPGKSDYYLLKKGKACMEAVIFEPSEHLVFLISERIKERDTRQ